MTFLSLVCGSVLERLRLLLSAYPYSTQTDSVLYQYWWSWRNSSPSLLIPGIWIGQELYTRMQVTLGLCNS